MSFGVSTVGRIPGRLIRTGTWIYYVSIRAHPSHQNLLRLGVSIIGSGGSLTYGCLHTTLWRTAAATLLRAASTIYIHMYT